MTNTIADIVEWLEKSVEIFPPDPEKNLSGVSLTAVLHAEGAVRECATAARAHYVLYGEDARDEFNLLIQTVLSQHWESRPDIEEKIDDLAIGIYLITIGVILDDLSKETRYT